MRIPRSASPAAIIWAALIATDGYGVLSAEEGTPMSMSEVIRGSDSRALTRRFL